VVTEISPLAAYYSAEEDHQNYYNENRQQPYCRAIIDPKVQKLRSMFKDRLKEEV
jgi:peptide methionine sulfoxide reductase msrA/msrB